MQDNLKRQFIWNTLGTGLYSFNSLFFLIAVTTINGVDTAGIFNFCFATSCIFYAVALYAGRTYQVTETKKSLNDNVFILNRIITTLIMIVVALIFGAFNGYSGNKWWLFVILCLTKGLEALCDVFHGVFQKNNKLDIAGKSLFFRCLFGFIIFVLIDILTHSIILSCVSLILSTLLFLLLVDIPISKKYNNAGGHINIIDAFRLLRFGVYTFGFTLIANYLVNAPRYALDKYMEVKYQAIFGIIVMPASIILLVNQFALQPLIMRMKASYAEGDKKGFLSKVYILFGAVTAIGLLSIAVAYPLGTKVLGLLYGVDVSNYSLSLIVVLIGASFYSLSAVMSNALMIMRKTRVQFFIYVITAIFAFITAYRLTLKLMFNGAILSYLLEMLFLMLLYAIYFIYCIKKSVNWSDK